MGRWPVAQGVPGGGAGDDRVGFPDWVDDTKLDEHFRACVRTNPLEVSALKALQEIVSDRPNILLIEDDESIAQMYAFGLSSNGYAVRVATSGESALSEATPDSHIGVIVLDLQLPHMGGITVLDELRHRDATAGVPVIVLSNYDVDFAEAERHGARECHPKYRTTPRDLVEYVERTLSGAA